MKRDVGVYILEILNEAKVLLLWHCFMMIFYYTTPEAFTPFVMWMLFAAYLVVIALAGVLMVLDKSNVELTKKMDEVISAYEKKIVEDADHLSLVMKLQNAGANESAKQLMTTLIESHYFISNSIKRANNEKSTTLN